MNNKAQAGGISDLLLLHYNVSVNFSEAESEFPFEEHPDYPGIEEGPYLESLPDYLVRKYGRVEIFNDDYG